MSSDVGNEDSLRRFVFERYPFRGPARASGALRGER